LPQKIRATAERFRLDHQQRFQKHTSANLKGKLRYSMLIFELATFSGCKAGKQSINYQNITFAENL